MNERTGGIDCCFYCSREIFAQGLCSVCLGQIDQDELSEPDPYGHGEDYWPEFDG
jgi:hypothetical protein